MKVLRDVIKEGRSDCPKCGNSNTFSVTREGVDLLYHCFHVSCGIKGRIKDDISLDYIRNNTPSLFNNIPIDDDKSKNSQDRYFVGLNNDCINYLSTYNIINLDLDLKYDPKLDRIVFPLKDLKNAVHGYVGRSISKKLPKWYVYYRDNYCPYISLGPSKFEYCIIVEDIISALRCNYFASSIAILGTNLAEGVISYLMNWKNLIICLDRDACNKAIKISKKLNFYKNSKVVFIDKDIKYFSNSELEELKKKIESN